MIYWSDHTKINVWLSLCLAMALWASCSGPEENAGNPGEEALVLSSEKRMLLADGKDIVVFRVMNADGEDCTGGCRFWVNGAEHERPEWLTENPGIYTVVAKAGDRVSNLLKIVAVDRNVGLKVVTDKNALLCDGGDLVELGLLDEFGNEVTELGGRFYVDGNELEGRYFKTNIPGIHKIKAVWNGREVPGSLHIGAFASVSFVNRVLVECFIGTDCAGSLAVMRILDPLAVRNDQVVLVEVHKSGGFRPLAYTEAWQGLTELRKYFGLQGTPGVYVNRRKTSWRTEQGEEGIFRQIGTESEVAIAIETALKGEEVVADVVVTATKEFAGKVATVLVEQGVTVVMDDRSERMTAGLLRDYVPGITGEDVVLTAGRPVRFTTAIPLSAQWSAARCRVIVYVCDAGGQVVQVQSVDAGKSVGY